jgi:membrane protein
MKKIVVLLCLFFSLLQFSYGEETFSNIEMPRNEYIISPFIGFGAIGVTTGFDFMYRHRSGFLTLLNLDISVPVSAMGGLAGQGELLFGYSIKRNNLYVGFSAGFWGGAGATFSGYELSYKYDPKGKVKLQHYPVFLILLAIRNDYTYFFNEKVGITASHSYGVGVHAGSWITFDLLSMFSFMAKVGVAFKV